MRQDTYQGQKLWNGEHPSPLVIEIGKLLSSGSSVLDLGAGNGRNAFYLAERGFHVEAVELDTIALEHLKQKNSSKNYGLSIIQDNITNFQPSQEFEAIVCDMVLHFLSSQEINLMIEKMKKWTKSGGYNLVTAYTDKNEIGKRPYLFKPNELRDYYPDWEIISYKEEPTDWFLKPPETIPRRNEAVYLLAKKFSGKLRV